MVRLFSDGFDAIDTVGNSASAHLSRKWSSATITGSAKVATGRYNGYALELDDSVIQCDVTPSGKHNIFFHLKTNSGYYAFEVAVGSNTKFEFAYDSMASTWQVTSTIDGTTYVDTGLPDFSSDWRVVDIVLDPSGTTANKVFVDNGLYAVHTRSFTHGNYVKFTAPNGSGMYSWVIDHFITNDFSGSFLNNRLDAAYGIDTLLAEADSSPDQWTANGSSDAYSVINSIPPSPSKFIEAFTDGHITKCTFTNLNRTPVGEITVVVNTLALNTDGANAKTLATVMDDSGASTEIGTDIDPDETLTLKTDVLYQNPITSSNWSQSSVNGLILGVKRKA